MTKRVCRDCPIPNCGAKYLVRLSNHLTDVHGLDYINRRKWLQEAKLQPKVRVMIYPAKTRRKTDLHLPKVKLSLAKRTFRYSGSALFNLLPRSMHKAESLSSFKILINTHNF